MSQFKAKGDLEINNCFVPGFHISICYLWWWRKKKDLSPKKNILIQTENITVIYWWHLPFDGLMMGDNE